MSFNNHTKLTAAVWVRAALQALWPVPAGAHRDPRARTISRGWHPSSGSA